MRPLVLVRAFLRRDWAIAISYRLPFLMNLLMTLVVLFPLHLVSKLVVPAKLPVSYQLGKGFFSFAAMGVLVLVLAAGAVTSFANEMREQQTTGTLEALLATPLPPTVLILGSALYEVVQSFLVAVVLLAVMMAAGTRLVADPLPLFLGAVDLVAVVIMFVAVGVAVGAFTLVFKRGGQASGLLLSGFAILCGAWYPVQLLPGPLHWLALCIPVTWGMTELRSNWLFGITDPDRLLAVIAGAAVLLALALVLFSRAVTHTRRTGTLAQY